MVLASVRRLVFGVRDKRARYRFTIAATATLLVLSLINARFAAGELWKTLDLPLWVGLVLTTSGIAGFEEYGLVHASIPPYLFTTSVLLSGNFVLCLAARPTMSCQLKQIIGSVLASAPLSFPLVLTGYLVGLGLGFVANGDPGPSDSARAGN